MKKSSFLMTIATALIGAGVLVNAADAPKTPATQPSTKPKDNKPVNKFCAVEGKGHDVDPKVTTEYKGKTIGFCCESCIDEFKKDPEKYIKKME
jgi:YHS domain-containing protein